MSTPRRSLGAHGGASVAESDPRFLPLGVQAPTPDARCIETSLSSLESDITPTNHFFVRSHFPVPKIDLASWRLTVEGEVDQPVSFTLEDLKQLPHHEVVSVVECAGNGRASVRPRPEGVLWGNGAVSAARWRGVSLRQVLLSAGVKVGATEVLFEGADRGTEPGVGTEIGYGMSISLAKALDPDTLLVDEMNGAPLEANHGFPLRAIVPGWYGMASVKWLTHVAVLDRPYQGYFRTRAYVYIREGEYADQPRVPVTSLRVKSLITWPREGQVLSTGPHWVHGVAWSGGAHVVRVEVSTTPASGAGEVWKPARLFPGASRHSWTHFEHLCDLPRPGFFTVRARATDENGNTQPLQTEWNVRGVGNNSIHAIPVEVRAGGPPDSV